MAFTLDTLAAELGIDPATLQAKPEVAAKWNGYLSEADTKYSQATAAQKQAADELAQAKREQAAIDEQIQKFGVSEARIAELESANVAYRAALEKAKESGLNIDLSGIRQPAATTPPDPTRTLQDQMKTGFSQMGAALRVQTRFQAVFGKPFADDPVALIDEAIAARMPVEQYAEKKYNFAAEAEKQRHAEVQAKIDAGVKAGVTKWQEDHPVTRGNPSLTKGLASKHPEVFKPRSAQETNDFRKLSPRDRISASVTRVREAIASNAE
jgi:hypothetical protein